MGLHRKWGETLVTWRFVLLLWLSLMIVAVRPPRLLLYLWHWSSYSYILAVLIKTGVAGMLKYNECNTMESIPPKRGRMNLNHFLTLTFSPRDDKCEHLRLCSVWSDLCVFPSSPALFSWNAAKKWIFHTCGAVGPEGPTPTQCLNSYRKNNISVTIATQGPLKGIQKWKVVESGTYRYKCC